MIYDKIDSNETLSEKLYDLINSLPYLQGYRKPDNHQRGVVSNAAGEAYDGVNFVVSGHSPVAFLMNNSGDILHEWSYSSRDMWPAKIKNREKLTHWRRARLLKNGHILAIFVDRRLLMLDRHSNLIWSLKGRYHHDMVRFEDKIYTLNRKKELIPQIKENEKILNDYIEVITLNGIVDERVSIAKCFLNSPYKSMMMDHISDKADIFHTNTIRVLDGSLDHLSPLFKKGHVLLTLKAINTTAIIDTKGKTVLWAADKPWRGHHDTDLTPNGDYLIFDNHGSFSGKSRVILTNPITGAIKWSYRGTLRNPLFSPTCGTAHLLGNGNILITESDNGRSIEVTPGKKIVWEYLTPHRVIIEGDEYVATLLEVERFDYDYVSWITAQ